MHGLGWLLGYAGLAAAVAVLTTCWGHMRGLYAQLSNRFVVSFSTTGYANVAMGEYLSREFKLSKFSRRRYDGACTFVRILDKWAAVIAANPCPVGMLLRTGWRPLWVSLVGDKEVGMWAVPCVRSGYQTGRRISSTVNRTCRHGDQRPRLASCF